MLPRRLAVLAAVSMLASTIAGACGSDANVDASRGDAGESSREAGNGICPDTAPAFDSKCLVPEGTTCSFGACGTPIARCTGGFWRYGGNPMPRPSCPALFPSSESACPPCWPTSESCTYGSCSGADASANTTVASCPDGTWRLDYFPCSVSDAGADVQGDADADAE